MTTFSCHATSFALYTNKMEVQLKSWTVKAYCTIYESSTNIWASSTLTVYRVWEMIRYHYPNHRSKLVIIYHFSFQRGRWPAFWISESCQFQQLSQIENTHLPCSLIHHEFPQKHNYLLWLTRAMFCIENLARAEQPLFLIADNF